jgi:hypothetical protein
MKTDDLIRILASDLQPSRPLSAQLAAGLIPALLIATAALWLVLGFRGDLLAAITHPVSAMRWVLGLALGVYGTRLAMALARPEGQSRARFWPLALVALVAALLLGWAFVSTPPEGRQMALTGKTMVTCLVTIPLLSILPVGAILTTLRHGATTSPALAGAVAGLAGGGLSAAIYALHCTEDSPLFYVTWYGLAILGVTIGSTLIGIRLLRW